MLFPEVERVVYKKNPLDNVICQLRFPPILKIDTEIPSSFQEMIRQDYPNLTESSEWVFETTSGTQKVPSDEIKQILQSAGNKKNYEFSSVDGKWKVNLTRNFLSLSTSNYRRWEEFRDRLKSPLEALINVYKPTHFSRLGLRYVDVIVRSQLGLNNVPWKQLINNNLLGALASSDIGDSVQNFESTYFIQLSGKNSMLRMVARTVKKADTGETCFMIDSDFSDASEHSEEEVIGKLDYLHLGATRMIRWCIKNRLHKAMEPEKL